MCHIRLKVWNSKKKPCLSVRRYLVIWDTIQARKVYKICCHTPNSQIRKKASALLIISWFYYQLMSCWLCRYWCWAQRRCSRRPPSWWHRRSRKRCWRAGLRPAWSMCSCGGQGTWWRRRPSGCNAWRSWWRRRRSWRWSRTARTSCWWSSMCNYNEKNPKYKA